MDEERDRVLDFVEDRPEFGQWLEDEDLYPPESVGEPRAENYLQDLRVDYPTRKSFAKSGKTSLNLASTIPRKKS